MISEVLIFLKNQLNTYLNTRAGVAPGDSVEDKVVLIDGHKMDPVTFKLGAVSVLLINIEEERVLRDADPYTRILPDGSHRKTFPNIRMNLYVLFVARFTQYEQGLRYLSSVIEYFQNHRVLDRQSAPALDENIEKLILELVSLPLSEQNEIWNALRTSYHPSVLYRVRMVVFRDEEVVPIPGIKETGRHIRNL